MSYGGVENTQDELDLLKGAKILDIAIRPVASEDDDPEFRAFAGDDDKIVMTVMLPTPVHFSDADGRPASAKKVTFEIWQDEEGNGPGYIAFTGGFTK